MKIQISKKLIAALLVGSSLNTFQLAFSEPLVNSVNSPNLLSVNSTADFFPSYRNVLFNLDLIQVREALQKVWMHGLHPDSYWSVDYENSFNQGTMESYRELILRSYLKALVDISTGVVDPSSIGIEIKFKKKDFISADQLQSLLAAQDYHPGAVIDQLAPQNMFYMSLKESLKKLYPLFQKGGWDRISPVSRVLSVGVSDPVVLKLKQRAALMGFRITNMDNNFDYEFQNVIKDIQQQLKIKPDGQLSPKGRTWDYFWYFCGERVRQIQADMEKFRWLPSDFEDRYIFVNTAFTTFLLVDKNVNDPVTMSFRTVNGTAERKTPMMKDKITNLVLNPTWTVPPTVFLNDKVALLKSMDSWEIYDYFENNNFQVFTSDFSRTIDPTTINWSAINSSSVDFYIQQKPNYMNALGVVKFMMTNPYAIYLHDTNQRELFSEAARLRSSGCIRLEKPMDLAEYLLKNTIWTREKIEDVVAKPGQVLDQETFVRLKNPIPVYLMSITSQLSSDGVLRLTEDVYGHNSIILKQLKGFGK